MIRSHRFCLELFSKYCLTYDFHYFRYEKKCDKKKVKKCEDVPKKTYETIHKRIPTQIEKDIPFRVCDGEPDHEYTPEEVATIDFSEYQS